MDRSSHSRSRPSNNHHPYHHNHHGPGRARGFSPPSNRYHQSAFPPPPHLGGPNPLIAPSDFLPPSHFWGLPPPFDPRAMPHPGAGPAPGPPMGEPWFDQMPAPPKGFNHHQFCPPFPPDHIHSQMGAHDYRGGGGRGDTRREERDLFFNHQQGMADYHRPPDFSNAASNSQLPGSGGMMSGGNYMLPPDQIIHPDSEIAPGLQFASCRSHAPLRPMVEVNKVMGSEDGDSAVTISVLSYNLLAQDLIGKNLYLYSNVAPEFLDWEFRKTSLLKDLTDSQADVLCLQEVQEDHYHEWFEPQLKEHGYSGVFQCRTGSHTDGCAVFYRTKKLQLLEWKGLTYRQTFKVLNRDNVGIVLKFAEQENSGSKQFCVATTHLLYNPKAGEVKLAQTTCLLAELHKMATVPGSGGLLPIVLCGDFNSTPNSPLVDFITSSFLNYSKMSAAEIAGYNHRKGQSRVIPSPLLPPSMNIGPNCMYIESESDCSEGTAPSCSDVIETTGYVRSGNDVLPDNQLSNGNVSGSEGGSGAAGMGTGDFVQSQNENFEESSNETERSLRRRGGQVRSARGAKARGMSYSGVKMIDFPSPSGGKSSKASVSPPPLDGQSIPSSSGIQTPEDTRAPNSPTEAMAGVRLTSKEEESGMEWEREKTQVNQRSLQSTDSTPEGKVELHSNTAAASAAGQLCRSDPRKRPHCHVHGLITHPFTFVTAYPQSRISTPSTVTTFHQSAFETVDYIFFTPPTKKKAGFHLLSRKALPSTHVLLDLGPQPHRYLSSDHLLLQATFQLVSSKGSQAN